MSAQRRSSWSRPSTCPSSCPATARNTSGGQPGESATSDLKGVEPSTVVVARPTTPAQTGCTVGWRRVVRITSAARPRDVGTKRTPVPDAFHARTAAFTPARKRFGERST